jgi:hypothetical protein
MLEALDAGEDKGFPAGARTKLAGARAYLDASVYVVRVRTDVPLPALQLELPREPRDPAALVELGERYALDSALNRLLAALQG